MYRAARFSFDHVVIILLPIVLRLLMNMYINQTIQVRWNNTLSNVCGISNGVKQGGCLYVHYLAYI